jgi:hypothetical protein
MLPACCEATARRTNRPWNAQTVTGTSDRAFDRRTSGANFIDTDGVGSRIEIAHALGLQARSPRDQDADASAWRDALEQKLSHEKERARAMLVE